MDVCYDRPHRAASSQSEIVARAETFVRAHLSMPVGIGQLCRVTGVSERTLRNAFYHEHGRSPKRVMLRLRLEQVREALRQSEAEATVTTVATAFGFYDLGRFAGQYKATFGEYPSDTLRARPTARASRDGGSATALPLPHAHTTYGTVNLAV